MFATAARKFYLEFKHAIGDMGSALPDWANRTGRAGPISTLQVFDRMIEDVATAKPGSMFFAHFLIPHAPYSVTSTCAIRRPLLQWKEGDVLTRADPLDTAPSARLARYERYIPQIRCALLKLEKLFARLKARQMFDTSIIIIHGDHGSRIVEVEPRIENIGRLDLQDFQDVFSTLFAVKSPHIAPGFDRRMMAVPELLRRTVLGDLDRSPSDDTDRGHTVFLRSPNSDDMKEVPMPALPDTYGGNLSSPAQ